MLVDRTPTDWARLWTLLFTAAHATSTLALSLPVVEGLDLTLTAMDLHQARKELDWGRPELVDSAPAVSLGVLPLRDDHAAAHAVIGQLVAAAMDRVVALAPVDLTDDEGGVLLTVLELLRNTQRSLGA